MSRPVLVFFFFLAMAAGCSQRSLSISGDPDTAGDGGVASDQGVGDPDSGMPGDLAPFYTSTVASWGTQVYDTVDGGMSYTSTVDPSTPYQGASTCLLQSNSANADDCGEIVTDVLDLSPWLGKRVRMTGGLKAMLQPGTGGAFLFEINGAGTSYVEDDMSNRYLTGVTPFTDYSLVLDVGPDTTGIYFGAYLCGPGEMWVSNLRFEQVDDSVPTTQTNSGP